MILLDNSLRTGGFTSPNEISVHKPKMHNLRSCILKKKIFQNCNNPHHTFLLLIFTQENNLYHEATV